MKIESKAKGRKEGKLKKHFVQTIGPQADLLFEASETGNCEALAVFVAQIGVNVYDSKRRTPLHLAAVNGHLKAVELLVSAGADVNSADINGNAPLHLAVVSNHREIVVFLLKSGADAECIDKFGRSPLDLLRGRVSILNDFCTRKRTETRVSRTGEDQDAEFIPVKYLNELKDLINLLSAFTRPMKASPTIEGDEKAGSPFLDMGSVARKLEEIQSIQDYEDVVNDLQSLLATKLSIAP